LGDQKASKNQIQTTLFGFHADECMFSYTWVQCEDGVVRYLNLLPTTTVEQFDKLDYVKKALIENQVALTDEQVKTLMFSIDSHPEDLTGHIT
jgi:hypothetical protein